jgi:hypothetical protein
MLRLREIARHGLQQCAQRRWVLSFVKSPPGVLARIAAAHRPEGAVALHEYFDHSTWRTAPRCPELEKFVRAAMASWRDQGREPDIPFAVPGWLGELASSCDLSARWSKPRNRTKSNGDGSGRLSKWDGAATYRQLPLFAFGKARNVMLAGASAIGPEEIAMPANCGTASSAPNLSSLPFN